MPRTTARRIHAMVIVVAALALPVRPAAAAGPATPLAPASRSIDGLWSWFQEQWGNHAGVAASRSSARGPRHPSVLTGKLGGFLDPDGARKLPQATPSVDLP